MNELLIPDYWLTGLGSWAVSYLLHSTVILGLVLLLTQFFRFISESAKDVLLKMGLVAGILTASIQFVQSSNGAFYSTIVFDVAPAPEKYLSQPAKTTRIITTDNLNLMMPNEVDSDNFAGPDIKGQRFTINWLNGLLICWLVGCLFFALRFARAWQVFKQAIGQRKALEHQDTLKLCHNLTRQMAIGRTVKLTCSTKITSPMAIGFSEVCIPHELWLQVDEEQLTAIIAHELAHISRMDPLWLFFWHLMSIVFFFQPFNKLTQLSFQSRAEFLADATAVRQTKDPVAMVNSLMSAAKLASAASLSTIAIHLLGRNATIVERSRNLLSEKLMKTRVSLSFIIVTALVIVSLSALLLPSISLASRQVINIMTDDIKLTPQNSVVWHSYTNAAAKFETNINYQESIAGKQLALKTKRVTFGRNFDGIAYIEAGGELRFVSRSIYGTTSLVITADAQRNALYQFRMGGELITDQFEAQQFIKQMLDEAVGQSDEFKRRMLRLYIEPQPQNNQTDARQEILKHLNRMKANREGYYANQDLMVAQQMLNSPELFSAEQSQHSASKWQEQPRFFNAMAHSGPYMASFNDFGYLSISHKQSGNIRVGAQYNLNDQRFLDLYLKASGMSYVAGDTEKAMVRFLVRLHFDVPPDDIKWLEE